MRRGASWPERRKTLGEASDPRGFAALAAAYLAWLESHNYSATTIHNRQHQLIGFIEWAELRGLTRPAEVSKPILERYQRHLFHYRKTNGRALSFASQQQRLISLRCFFRWLVRQDFIPSNPAADLEMPRKETRLPKAILSAEEADRVMAAVSLSHQLALRDRAILETFYSTGIRRRELIGLKLVDVDFDRQLVFIRQGKGKKDRIVPIGQRALSWIDRYLQELRPRLLTGREEGFLFLTDLGESMTPDPLSRMVREHLERSGIAKTGSCHLFRHTMATLMLENGADIRFIQQMLGHASLRTTEIYTHVSIRKLQEIHRATHPADNPAAVSAAAELERPGDPPEPR